MNIHIDGSRHRDDAERVILASIDEFVAIRRDLHQYPELSFQERRTSGLVARYLQSYGYEVTEGVGGYGVVATLSRGQGGKRIGIRADIDALPIEEATNLDYSSRNPGVMHACGHDGHATILLAAARYLAEHGKFDGTLTLIFQPAEEVGAGARKMIEDRLFERFPIDAIFGLHNWPGVTLGQFGFVEGPAMASVDQALIRIVGRGGHGAAPHEAVDPVLASASFIIALQSIVARNVDPLEMAVLTVGSIHGGSASNVIPESVELKLTARAYSEAIRDKLEERLPALARAQAESFGAFADVNYRRGFPAVINHAEETRFARRVAEENFPVEQVAKDFRPRTASEDFAYMLQQRPGSYLFVGNGDSSALHSPHYNFNDEIIAPAARFWVRLAETYLS
ncbi:MULTISPECIES: M20 aminoacylase family protein [unclassified Neorhizobium]|uniref:M20 aminoacylase family protein n=1 Tax=unclassified Neorhizobium TaxID=2629175 RepID=UPI001FF67D92|nr:MULTISPECIES: M20 aminoacylase family protein [unclassified Neorhizobium]MCJ9669377.1 M20 family metallopeptidase [Neorhizobium sp. SHOUNA12B]MCJ9745245.1 M20 family metallopeptidase [Neorhizobium sp. SHOUNA12A]